MALRHIVLMKLTGGADKEFIVRMDAAVSAMARAIPEVRANSSGVDVSGKPENFDYAFIFDFADSEAYGRYRMHPAHQAFIVDFMRVKPMEKVRIQLSLPD